MVKSGRKTHNQDRNKKTVKGSDAMIESQGGVAKSDKKSVASKGTSKKEDAKIKEKDQEDSDAKKGLCNHQERKSHNQDGSPETKKHKKSGRSPPLANAQ
eukprot:679183-Ditylum_brightwellii.AAC.1